MLNGALMLAVQMQFAACKLESQVCLLGTQEAALARLWRLYSRSAALIFASSHTLATACAVTGEPQCAPWLPALDLICLGWHIHGYFQMRFRCSVSPRNS